MDITIVIVAIIIIAIVGFVVYFVYQENENSEYDSVNESDHSLIIHMDSSKNEKKEPPVPKPAVVAQSNPRPAGVSHPSSASGSVQTGGSPKESGNKPNEPDAGKAIAETDVGKVVIPDITKNQVQWTCRYCETYNYFEGDHCAACGKKRS